LALFAEHVLEQEPPRDPKHHVERHQHPNQTAASPGEPLPRNTADAFTAAMTSGTSKGKMRSGRRTSRARDATEIEANNVASAEKPRLPSAHRPTSATGARGTMPNKIVVSGNTTACRIARLAAVPSILAMKIDAGSSGAVFRPSMQRFSRSSRNVRCAPSVPANTNEIHSPAAADSGVGFSGMANCRIKSTSKPSTNRERRPVFDRNSIRRSFCRISHTLRVLVSYATEEWCS